MANINLNLYPNNILQHTNKIKTFSRRYKFLNMWCNQFSINLYMLRNFGSILGIQLDYLDLKKY